MKALLMTKDVPLAQFGFLLKRLFMRYREVLCSIFLLIQGHAKVHLIWFNVCLPVEVFGKNLDWSTKAGANG